MAAQIPIIRRSWHWSRLKNSIQFNGLEETPDSKIISLSGSFVNLHSWNWHCPGHELSPKTKENYMKPYAFSEIFTR